MLDCEIVSADSRQFFREMTIGTAKPTVEELSQAKHHFVDSLSIHEEYSVGKFETDTLALLEKLFEKKDYCILTGGSGLYLNAICNGLDRFPDVDPSYRAALNEELAKGGLETLIAELAEKDPVYFEKVDQKNPHRITRALEVIRSAGKPFSSFLRSAPVVRPFEIVRFQMSMERISLYDRINRRVDIMVAQGLEEEARSLYPLKTLNALRTVGYSEWFDYFEGTTTREEAIELIKRNSRRYAKRQITWFKNQGTYMPVIQGDNAVSEILSEIKKQQI